MTTTETPDEASASSGEHVSGLSLLRSTGVVAVLGTLLWGSHIRGGYIGIDVLFVVSGFCVTASLLRRPHSSGWRSPAGHRAKRLLPGAYLLIAGVLLYCLFGSSLGNVVALRRQTFGGLFMVSNWVNITLTHGLSPQLYEPTPLEFLWAPSVGVQIFLAGLAVMWLLRNHRQLLGGVLLGLIVLSAVDMVVLYGSGAGAARAYFGTDTHAQPLLVGALVAWLVVGPRSTQLVSLVRRFSGVSMAVAATGIAVVLAAVVRLTPLSPYYFRGGLLAISLAVGFAILILVLLSDRSVVRALDARPFVWFGGLSYGIILFALPFERVTDPARTYWPLWCSDLVTVLGAIVLAIVLDRVVEPAVATGRFRPLHLPLAPLTAILTAPLIVFALTFDSAVAPALPDGPTFLGLEPITATKPLEPGLTRVLIVGDEQAAGLALTVANRATNAGLVLSADSVLGCGLVPNVTTLFAGQLEPGIRGWRPRDGWVRCDRQLQRWNADVHAVRPAVVVMAEGAKEVRNQITLRGVARLGQPRWDARVEAQIMRSIDVLSSTGAHVVLLTIPPYASGSQFGTTQWPENDLQRTRRYNELLVRAAARSNGRATVVDLGHELAPSGVFTEKLGSRTVRSFDGVNLAEGAAPLLERWLLPQLKALGVQSASTS